MKNRYNPKTLLCEKSQVYVVTILGLRALIQK